MSSLQPVSDPPCVLNVVRGSAVREVDVGLPA